jgi:hypothetical protein
LGREAYRFNIGSWFSLSGEKRAETQKRRREDTLPTAFGVYLTTEEWL